LFTVTDIEGQGQEIRTEFLLEVVETREDAATNWEAGMRITEPIRYAPPPTLGEPWARATLTALATPRARA